MKHLIIVATVLSLILGGCATNQTKTDKQSKPSEYISKSQKLVKQHRWGDAITVIKSGLKAHPKNKTLTTKLKSLSNQWKGKKRRLEDWILVYETEGMLQKRPLLISMVQSDSGDYLLKSRLLFLDSLLSSKRKSLVLCAQYHTNKELRLAKRCINAALKIEKSDEGRELQRKISSKQSHIEKQEQNRQERIEARSKAEAREKTLNEAQWQLESQFYYEAIKLLEPLAIQHPDDEAVEVLLKQAQEGRAEQVDKLIYHGDQLYREEHIEQAVAIWEQAASIDPQHSGLAQRIERAQKVLSHLNQIRTKDEGQ